MKKLYSARTIILAGSLLLQLSTLCFQSRGAAGDVDLSFDPGSGVNGPVNTVVVQPDGKVLIGGGFTSVKGLARPGIARLNADGSGDPTFNPVTNCVGAFALQPDGKLIVSRQAMNGNGYAVRLNSDGTLDGSFIAAPGTYSYGSVFTSVVLQPDGKVVLGGAFYELVIDDDYYYIPHFLVVRLNANGTPDNSFAAPEGQQESMIQSMVLQPDGKVLFETGIWSSPILRLNANGSPDSTFNPGTGPNGGVYSIALQSDGKVLIGGFFTAVNGTNQNGIARLNSNGSLDNTFNPGTGVGLYPSGVNSVVVQSDGKVLIGGYFTAVNGTNRNSIARLNANGSLDGSFNPGAITNNTLYAPVLSVVVQSDGKVLIGGYFTKVNGTNRNWIARLNANGSLDSTFNPGTTEFNTAISSVVVQPDGKVLVSDRWEDPNTWSNRKGVARLNADGSLDSSFNAGTAPNGHVVSMALQSEGKALIGGDFNMVNGVNRLGIARLNANGSLDSSFNTGTALALYVSVQSIAVQSDGKVLVGGYFDRGGGTLPNRIARLSADGALDSSFHPDTGVTNGGVLALALQPDGKVLVGGYYLASVSDPVNGDYDINAALLTRLNSDGSRDTSFESALGEGGLDHQYGQAVAVQPDGKVLFGGSFSTLKGASRNRIARLNANGTLDTGFNPGSGVAGDSGYYDGFPPGVRSIAVQPDGKMLIAGSFTAVDGTNRSGIARLNANGSLDGSFNPGTGANGAVVSVALQSDGNVLIGGGFLTVNGVLRPSVARLYGDSAPSLNIARSNAFVIVSWPSPSTGFELQQNTDQNPTNWTTSSETVIDNGTIRFITVTPAPGNRFYRLFKP